ncbi:transcription termination/antitermination protein NusG [Agrobacterium sp.]|uniref:transcription termination/antitermination protein NusG n=1 Tax=Agrobacterium sp. TaxID=361 RepID=UPI0028A8BA25|nr:transcription termination/antitermination protein NusG [Agrobacterium sp.]
MMQHNSKHFCQSKPIEIRPFADDKQDRAIANHRIQIRHIGMASRRIAEDYPDLAAWFCLKVVGGREFSVEKALHDEGVWALVPTRKGDKIMKRHRIIPAPTLPVLPGYLLVRCVPSPAAFAGLVRFNKVLGIVGGGDDPYRVPKKFVSKFITKAQAGDYDSRRITVLGYGLKDNVKVVDGPFASFPGVVVAIDVDKARVEVEVNIFGRPTPVELDVAQIEKV